MKIKYCLSPPLPKPHPSFFYKQEYAKADDDVRKAQELGYEVHPGFLEALKRARSGN